MAGLMLSSDRPLPRKYLSYNEDQNSRLHFACYFGDYKLALMLLLSAEGNIEARNIWQETPLHHCSSQGHLEIMLLLLDGGANVNALDKDHYTPLHHAIIHGNKDAAELLLCYRANIFNDAVVMEINRHGNPDSALSVPRSPLELAGSVHVCRGVIEKARGCVWSLQHHCRLAIRRHLGVGKRKRIKELPLPRHLISYLTTLPVEFSNKLHENWDRVRVGSHSSSSSGSSCGGNRQHRDRPLISKDGTRFKTTNSLQALKTSQNSNPFS